MVELRFVEGKFERKLILKWLVEWWFDKIDDKMAKRQLLLSGTFDQKFIVDKFIFHQSLIMDPGPEAYGHG